MKQAYQVLDARRFHIIDNPVILGKHTPVALIISQTESNMQIVNMWET